MLLGLTILSLIIWLVLLSFWGGFWLASERISPQENQKISLTFPSVCAVVPARNEAEVLPISLKSLLTQEYEGKFSVILIDDQSSDRTSEVASEIAANLNRRENLDILSGKPLPFGWSGKLWAMNQGIEYALANFAPSYFLLTDADIKHDSNNLRQLVIKAEQEKLDLVSLMVLLRCESFWEKLLIPAFVFFFQKLYPFAWVNNPSNKTAAAAGGCILICAETLKQIGGIEVLREALIDDCTLASAVKSNGGKTWLGLTTSTVSLRPYDTLSSIWDMVARTAFTQLNYSPLLLVGTIIGMSLVYLVAPIGCLLGNNLERGISLLTYGLMAYAYFPTVRLYRLSPVWALSLPAIAFLYSLMTVDSARRYWQGKGGAWKGRVYPVR